MTSSSLSLASMTRRALIVSAACAALCLPMAANAEDALTAQQIIDKMSARNNALGFSQGQAQITLLIKDKSGDKRVRSMQVKSKRFGDASKSVVKLMAPKEVKGQSFLFAENKNADDDVWMFLPAFKVTRRIEGSNKKGAFLGLTSRSPISNPATSSRGRTRSSQTRRSRPRRSTSSRARPSPP